MVRSILRWLASILQRCLAVPLFPIIEHPSGLVACIPVIALFHRSLPCHVLSCCTIP